MIDGNIYELRIALAENKPEIWRVLQVPASITLRKLHKVIQLVMGWENYHLYSFEKGGIIFGRPDPDFADYTINDNSIPLYCLLKREGDQLSYIYDFGDNWQHQVSLQRILPENPDMKSPLCLDGTNACPPEDCGSHHGYDQYREAMLDPTHEQHEEYLSWRGTFDPYAFDLLAVNRALRRVKA